MLIKITVRVFETDIPAQHFWSPESGQYRVLWEKTFDVPIPFDKYKGYKKEGS